MNPMEMAVKLLGDASSFQGMIKQAQDTLSTVAQDVKSAGEKIEAIGEKVGSFLQSALEGIAGLNIGSYLQEAFGLYQEQEQAEFRLRAALIHSRQEVDKNFESLSAYADQLQKTTIHGNEHSIQLMQMAINLGLTAEQSKRAVRNALALADSSEVGVNAALRLTAGLEKGRTEGFQRYYTALERIQNPIQRVHYVQGKLNEVFEVSKEIANTTSGRLNQLRDAMDNMKEEFGSVVADGIRPFLDPAQAVMEWVTEINPGVKRLVVILASVYSVLLLIGPAFKLLTTLGFAFFNPFLLLVTVATTLVTMWVHAVGDANKVWEQVRDTALPILQSIWEWLVLAYQATLNFIVANREVIAIVVGVGVAVTGSIIAYKTLMQVLALLKVRQLSLLAVSVIWKAVLISVQAVVLAYTVAMGIMSGVMATFEALLSVSFGLWFVWKAAVLLAKVVVLAFALAMGILSGVVMIFKASLSITTALQLAYAAATGIAKAATWLLNAALTVTNALLTAGVGIIGTIIVLVIALGAPFVILAATIKAVYETTKTLFATLDQIPRLDGPIGAITSVFMEWWEIIKLVYRALGVDMGLAWKIVVAGATLAVAQLGSLWGPLWKFIREGWSQIFEAITQEFSLKFKISLLEVMRDLVEMSDIFGFAKSKIDALNHAIGQLRGDINTLSGDLANTAARGVALALKQFKFEDNDAIKDARKALKTLTDELTKKEEENNQARQNAQDKINEGLGQEYKLKQALKGQNASLFQSAEALAKATAYREQLLYGPGGGIYQGRPVAPLGAEAVRAHTTYMEETRRRQMEGGKAVVPLPPGTLVPGSPLTPIILPGQPRGPMVPAQGPQHSAGDEMYKKVVVNHLVAMLALVADIAKKPAPAIPVADFAL